MTRSDLLSFETKLITSVDARTILHRTSTAQAPVFDNALVSAKLDSFALSSALRLEVSELWLSSQNATCAQDLQASVSVTRDYLNRAKQYEPANLICKGDSKTVDHGGCKGRLENVKLRDCKFHTKFRLAGCGFIIPALSSARVSTFT